DVNVVPEGFVSKQLKSVLSDMQVDVVKTGMLPSTGIVQVLHQCLKEFPVRALVVDPVMVSTSGDVLAGPAIISVLHKNVIQVSSAIAFAIARYSTSTLDLETVGCFFETHEMRLDPRYTQMPELHLLQALLMAKAMSGLVKRMQLTVLVLRLAVDLISAHMIRAQGNYVVCVDSVMEKLLPMADLVTPNLKEASALLGDMPLTTISDMRHAAMLIYQMGSKNVLIKGGDLPDSLDAVDIFFDGKDLHELRSSRIKSRNTHGTGCSLASCIAAELAKGSSMFSAVKASKQFIERALRYSKDINIGHGPQGPFDHLCCLKNREPSMNERWDRSITDAVKDAVEGGATIVQIRFA
ncbi:hypothetical protein Csa_018853, partial [Cucumis sativus]